MPRKDEDRDGVGLGQESLEVAMLSCSRDREEEAELGWENLDRSAGPTGTSRAAFGDFTALDPSPS